MVHRTTVEGFTNVIASHITSQYIAISLVNKTVSVFTSDGGLLHVLRSRDNNQTRCLLVPGSSLICGNVGGNIETWDLVTGDFQHTLTGHPESIVSVVSISTNVFATCSRDNTVRLWDVGASSGEPRCVHVLRGHTLPMNSLSFDPDSNLLASTGKDACRVWRLTGESVAAFSNSHARISTSVFALGPRGDSVLVTGDEDGELVTCDITTEAKLQTLDGHTAMIRWIVAPQQGSGDVLVSADITGTIVAWIYVQGAWKVNRKLSEAHAFSVSAMRIKDKLLLTGGADGKIRIRHLDTGALLRELEEIYDAVYDVEFQDFAEKEIVAVASRNGRTVADFHAYPSTQEIPSWQQ